MKNNFFNQSGFTIVELIIAGSISVTMIGIGYSIVQIALEGNKIDSTQMSLSGRLNDTLDFILDEVKVGKKIIDDESDITALNTNCIYPDDGEFLFGIRLPDQSLVKSDYNPEGDQFNLNQVECPIVYTIRPSNSEERMPFALVRYGPQYNEKGYYISPSFQDFQETVLLDGISSTSEYDQIVCPQGDNLQVNRGITFCIDRYKKSIEIQIEAEDSQNGKLRNTLKSLASVGGFSAIQDESQVNLIPATEGTTSELPGCIGGRCCWLGVCLRSKKVTYMIDKSTAMKGDYEHSNGEIINGEWMPISDPDTILARINGKSLLSIAISTLKQNINRLEISDNVYIQIVAFDNEPQYLFEDGPRKLTIANKNEAIGFLNRLSAEEEDIAEDEIEPWPLLCEALESDSVEQIILLSASIPSTTEGPCVGMEGNYAEIIDNYNRITRSKSGIGSLIINSISLFHNFCETSKNYRKYEVNSDWLGLISSGAESACTHIK